MTDAEITEIIRKWCNTANDSDRRWAIYYSMDGVDEYSHVWFVGRVLEIPGYNPEHFNDKQNEFCCHVCDIFKDMTRELIAKPL